MENYGMAIGMLADFAGGAILLFRFGTKRVINNKPDWLFRTYLFASVLLGQGIIVASMRQFPTPWDIMLALTFLGWNVVSIAATFTVSTRWIAYPLVYIFACHCFCIASVFSENEDNMGVTQAEIARVVLFGMTVTIGAAITLALAQFRSSRKNNQFDSAEEHS